MSKAMPLVERDGQLPLADNDYTIAPVTWVPDEIAEETHMTMAIDPGDRHVGVAFFRPKPESTWGHECFFVKEMDPNECQDVLAELVVSGSLVTVVYERFTLQGNKAAEQVGSEFLTSQLIGAIRWMVRKQNEHAYLHDRVIKPQTLSCLEDGLCSPHRVPQPVALVGQMNMIKKPTRAILNRRGIRSLAARQRAGIHCKDAELHGWHWLLNGRPADIEERPKLDSRNVQRAR